MYASSVLANSQSEEIQEDIRNTTNPEVPEEVMLAWRESATPLTDILAYCKEVDHDKLNSCLHMMLGRRLYFCQEEKTQLIQDSTTYSLGSSRNFDVVEAVRVEPAPKSPNVVMRYFDYALQDYNDVVIGKFEGNFAKLDQPVNMLTMLGSPVLVMDGDHYDVHLVVGGFTAEVRSCVQNIVRDHNFCFKQGDQCVTYYVK